MFYQLSSNSENPKQRFKGNKDEYSNKKQIFPICPFQLHRVILSKDRGYLTSILSATDFAKTAYPLEL